jgi:hypothetical protein
MNEALRYEFRYLAPAWLGSVLLSWLALLLWRSEDGVLLALGMFFLGSVSLVAYSFRRDTHVVGDGESEPPRRIWQTRMVAVLAALLAAWAAFASVHLALNGRDDFVSVVQALSALIPACCIAPYLTRLTRWPFAAVVFTAFLVACMKLLGCVVVVLVHGWDAAECGYTTMPWAQPNLLVWLFWVNTAVLSLGCAGLGVRQLRAECEPGAAADGPRQ